MRLFATVAQALSLTMLALALAACGGSGSAQAKSSKLSMSVQWPERGRLIPDASESIKLAVFSGTEEIASKVVARPASGSGSTTIVIDKLPPIQVTLKASAYPQADGTGSAQATGTTIVQLASDSTTSASILMGTTIDHVALSPAVSSVQYHESKELTATAFDQANNMILTSPARWTWTASNGNLTVSPSGNTCTVMGASAGSVSLTAKETESGKQLVKVMSVTSNTGANGYTIRPIGTPGVVCYSINDHGDIAGYYWANGTDHPVVYRNGVLSELPTTNFPGFITGQALAINNDGKIVGFASDGTTKACVWYPDGSHRYLRDAAESRGTGVGPHGQILGQYRSGPQDIFGPVVWADDDANSQGFAGSGGSSIVMNETGDIAYAYFDGSVFYGKLVIGGTTQTLQGSGTGDGIIVYGMSGNRTVGQIGNSIALWTGTTLTILGPGGARSCNSDGVIVGTTTPGSLGFVFTVSTGIEDLLGKVTNSSGWVTLAPRAINANGQIVGGGIYNNQGQGFLLTPN